MKSAGIKILFFIVAGIVLQSVFNLSLIFHTVCFLIGLCLSRWHKNLLWLVILPLSGINLSLKTPPDFEYPQRDLLWLAQVIAEDQREKDAKLTLNLKEVILKDNSIPLATSAYFYTTTQKTLLGKELLIKGKISNSRGHPRMNILSGRIVDVRPSRLVLCNTFYFLRNYIDNLFSNIFNHTHYRLASSLILGGSNRIGKDLKEVFVRAGVIHILAVSGLHIGFVCLFIGTILFLVPIPQKYKYLITILVLMLYAGITGFRPSICRATLMAILFGLALILQRNTDGIHIVNISAIILLTINPLLLFDVGAQLSFAAVYGIIYLYKIINTTVLQKIKRKNIKIILSAMVVSFSAQLAVSPLLIYYFNRLPTLAVFSNLLIVPIASVIVFLLFLCIIIGNFCLPLVKVIAIFISILLDGLTIICKTISALPFSTLSMSVSPIILLFCYLLFPKNLRKLGLFLIVGISIILSISRLPELFEFKVSPVGTLVSLPSGESLFITKGSSGKNAIFIANQGIEELDYLIAARKFYPVKSEFITIHDRLR